MHLISAGGLHGKGFGGHADSVFNEKQACRVEIMAIQSRYCMLELVFFKVLSHTDTVHEAEDASESGFIRYPVADEIVAGSPQNSVYMYMYITSYICTLCMLQSYDLW